MGIIRAIQVAGRGVTTTGTAVNLDAGSLDLGDINVGTIETLTATNASDIEDFTVGQQVQFSVRVGSTTGRAVAEIILLDGRDINLRVLNVTAAFPFGTADAVSIQALTLDAAVTSPAIAADQGGFIQAILAGDDGHAASNAEKRLTTVTYDLATDVVITSVREGTFVPVGSTITNNSTSTLTYIINS